MRAQKEEALFYFGEAKENRMVRKNKRMLEIAREFYPKLNIVKASFHKELSEKMENEVKEELKKETLEFETLRSTDNFCGFAYDVVSTKYSFVGISVN